ncbi:hypothetical protein [Streptomyces caniscabiei]|uniref:hypothetical protein n=1 Tax=Streptomyces caniscabiei TaxID=2746961 RepID=UPI00076612F3|nr:hypothetical protein [Streptomyces caniscabiei]
MSFYLALLAAAALMVGGSAIMLRPAPRGRHCRRRVLLARPVDALEKTSALCSTEGRVTSHARVRITGQFVCIDCRNPSPDPASYEVREEAPRG